MTSGLLVFFLSMLCCMFIAYIIGLFWFGDKRNRAMLSFFILGLVLFVWILLNGIVFVTTDPFFAWIYSARMMVVAVVPFAVTWFLLDFMGSTVIQKRAIRIFLIVFPSIDIIALLTNPLHHLYFSSYEQPIPPRGIIFWIHMIADFVVIILVFIWLIRFVIRNYTKQKTLVLSAFAMLLPYAFNITYSFGLIPLDEDLTPLAFFITYLMFLYVSFDRGMFSLRTDVLTSTIEEVNDIIIVFNEKGKIIDFNKRAQKAFSRLQFRVHQSKVEDLVLYMSQRQTKHTPCDLFDKIEHGESVSGELSAKIRGNDTVFAVNLKAFTKGRSKQHFLLLLKDVTTYREMINEINEQNEQLTQLNILSNAASKAKSEFLANMSHEIRTPLNAITGMARIGLDATEASTKDNSFQRIQTASMHLLNIINDILDMSKIEARKFQLSPAPFSLESLFLELQTIFEFQMQQKQLRFSMKRDKLIPDALYGDAHRLSQVLTNLISNAMKFTPAGGAVSVSVSRLKDVDTRKELDSGMITLQFIVEDNGRGITKEQQSRIFDAFEQAENTTSREYGGTGLGLALCKSIVGMMGGSIWVDSAEGQGSRFYFTVVLSEARKEAQESLLENKEQAEDDHSSFSGQTILLAEDVEINQEIIQTILSPYDLNIECAENGEVVVQTFTQDPTRYSLILMDIQMPKMSGLDATKAIRAMNHPHAQSIPIIAMTANVFQEDVDTYLSSGFQDHIGKPLDFDELLRILHKYLDKRFM